MNLFRSEEHVRNWSGFKSGTEEGMVQLLDMLNLFSSKFFAKRIEPDYVSHMHEYGKENALILKEMGSFWQPPEH
jgi:hypothetical protein